MSILFSGDFHANARGELTLLTNDTLLNKFGAEIYSNVNYHIILGDGGFGWENNEKRDKYNYKKLAERSFPILVVQGNHEPIYGMKNVKEIDIGIGEKVLVINKKPFTAYLKRGNIYTIDGIKFLVLGGALSIDKYRRTENKSWWKNEYWSDKEKKDLFELLEKNNSFDCIISHTGPWHINVKLFHYSYPLSIGGNYEKINDKVAKLNDEIHEKIYFNEWWCGHFHQNLYYYDSDKNRGYQYLYKSTKILEKNLDRITVFNEHGMMKR